MNYQINILPVISNKSAVLDLLLRFLGPDQKDMVEILIKSGGTVLQNLNKQTATNIANQLRKLGVGVEVTTIDLDEANKQYTIRLLSAGKYEVRVVKLLSELTSVRA